MVCCYVWPGSCVVRAATVVPGVPRTLADQRGRVAARSKRATVMVEEMVAVQTAEEEDAMRDGKSGLRA